MLGVGIADLSARAFAATFSLVWMTAEKSLNSQLRALSNTARERVFPVRIHPQYRGLRIASRRATVPVRMWPSPCPAKTANYHANISHASLVGLQSLAPAVGEGHELTHQ